MATRTGAKGNRKVSGRCLGTAQKLSMSRIIIPKWNAGIRMQKWNWFKRYNAPHNILNSLNNNNFDTGIEFLTFRQVNIYVLNI